MLESEQGLWHGVGELGYLADIFDVNDDGIIDICLLGTKSQEMDLTGIFSYFLGNGDGTFGEQQDGNIEGDTIEEDSVWRLWTRIRDESLNKTYVPWSSAEGTSIYVTSLDHAPLDMYQTKPHPFQLGRNYPNPFNSSTSIPFALSETCPVKLDIYNLSGQHVTAIVDESMTAGKHIAYWQVPPDQAAGIYLCRLMAGGQIGTMKILYLK